MADERDGIFGTGTFDNAEFGTVYATSNAGVYSTVQSKVSLYAESFANVFSSSDRVLNLSRAAESHVGTVFSNLSSLVRQFTLNFSSYANAYSVNSRVFAFDRANTSFANVFSNNNRVLNFVRDNTSFAAAYSTNSRTASFVRSASSYASAFSANKLLVKLKASSFVGFISSVNRALTSSPDFTGSGYSGTFTANFDNIRVNE